MDDRKGNLKSDISTLIIEYYKSIPYVFYQLENI